MLNLLYAITLSVCCAGLPPLDKNGVEGAEIIFVGEVIEVTHNDRLEGEYHFKVLLAYKGVEPNEIIKVSSNLTSEGIHARVGQEWLIIPHVMNGRELRTSICSYSGNMTDHRPKKNARFLRRYF